MEEGQLLIMKVELTSLEGVQSFLELGKHKMKIVRDDLIVPKFCGRLNLSTGVHIVKEL
jgi:hypothetical protein